MFDDSQINLFRTRLAETIAWCTARTDVADPKNSLRSPELTPSNYSVDERGYAEYAWRDSAWPDAVLQVAVARSRILMADGNQPKLPHLNQAPAQERGGHLALMMLAETTCDGLSDPESGGFYDGEDIPPWDTWLWLLEEEHRSPFNEPLQILVSWVPALLVPNAHRGMEANPTGCLRWADTRISELPFLQKLQDCGLLRQGESPKSPYW